MKQAIDPEIQEMLQHALSSRSDAEWQEHDRRIREERARERAAEERARMEARRDELVAWGIPRKDIERIASGRIEDWEPMQAIRQCVAERRAWRPEVSDSPRCIYVLAGAKGRGKTTAASYFLADPSARWPRHPYHPLFVTTARLQRWQKFDNAAMEALEKAPALVIDDLGTEYIDSKGALQAFVHGVVNERYNNWLDTVLTSNLTRLEFRERWGELLYDRLREVGRFFEFAGESMRGRGKP